MKDSVKSVKWSMTCTKKNNRRKKDSITSKSKPNNKWHA
jgi:hypothetical protein